MKTRGHKSDEENIREQDIVVVVGRQFDLRTSVGMRREGKWTLRLGHGKELSRKNCREFITEGWKLIKDQ